MVKLHQESGIKRIKLDCDLNEIDLCGLGDRCAPFFDRREMRLKQSEPNNNLSSSTMIRWKSMN